jgi:hypothetical protein
MSFPTSSNTFNLSVISAPETVCSRRGRKPCAERLSSVLAFTRLWRLTTGRSSLISTCEMRRLCAHHHRPSDPDGHLRMYRIIYRTRTSEYGQWSSGPVPFPFPPRCTIGNLPPSPASHRRSGALWRRQVPQIFSTLASHVMTTCFGSAVRVNEAGS